MGNPDQFDIVLAIMSRLTACPSILGNLYDSWQCCSIMPHCVTVLRWNGPWNVTWHGTLGTSLHLYVSAPTSFAVTGSVVVFHEMYRI